MPPIYTPVEQNIFELPSFAPIKKLRLIIESASQFPVLVFELKVWQSFVSGMTVWSACVCGGNVQLWLQAYFQIIFACKSSS